MKDSIKRFFITALLLALSIGTAFLIDAYIDKREKEEYPQGDSESVRQTVTQYAETYEIPEEVIYTVIKMRSGFDRSYEKDGRIGYMGLDATEISEIEKLLETDVTEDMARDPSYNLLFGVQYLRSLYSGLGDWNAVYAALLCGKEKASEWSSNTDLTDVTGTLVSLPEDNEFAKEFEEYLKTEEKYAELYYSEAVFSEESTGEADE